MPTQQRHSALLAVTVDDVALNTPTGLGFFVLEMIVANDLAGAAVALNQPTRIASRVRSGPFEHDQPREPLTYERGYRLRASHRSPPVASGGQAPVGGDTLAGADKLVEEKAPSR